MEKGKISEYREKLDKTLASAELTNEETLKNLIKNQILRSSKHEKEGYSEDVLEKRTMELSNFLAMLRSASVNDHELSKTHEASHGEWKLKQDNEEFRVMYREGPQGTPFHSLLVEGYVDGPVDVCLCISWESPLYKKWWPQSSFPPFKITTCECLQKVQIGEQISLVRVKVAWPLSAREALVHYFLFEYFEDDLIVILLNTISDIRSIDRSTHGFTKDGIPEAKDVVRIDLVGGFALQKVTMERSYFRTITNMDMKLDFVPPALINFISRQLIGNGFRLYQKAVASVSNCDEDYCNALNDPLYARMREALYSIKESQEALEVKELKIEECIQDDKHLMKETLDVRCDVELDGHAHDPIHVPSLDCAQGTKRKTFGEIEEEESEESTFVEGEIEEEEGEDSTYVEEDCQAIEQSLARIPADKNCVNDKKNISIRPEVEQALVTLDKVISMVREYGLNGQKKLSSFGFPEDSPDSEKSVVNNLISKADDGDCSRGEVCIETSKKEVEERTLPNSRNTTPINDVRSNSFSREANHNRIAPASSPLQDILNLAKTNHSAPSSPRNQTTDANGIHENGVKKPTNSLKKYRFCCFSFKSSKKLD
ncbi:hypothetical protein SLEP1_g5039 [Rubroshorea leprosula]|uniref:Uncharacterized protein n=1 Tax=Rubroshorea leprosula TaxID=152421 RepID=A0AAV5HX25_9ROSI|nr:hypothetical protein SLEP1_g5039 [Rubroshorea leprosula]